MRTCISGFTTKNAKIVKTILVYTYARPIASNGLKIISPFLLRVAWSAEVAA
jgi:hypothetical protein